LSHEENVTFKFSLGKICPEIFVKEIFDFARVIANTLLDILLRGITANERDIFFASIIIKTCSHNSQISLSHRELNFPAFKLAFKMQIYGNSRV